jgi:hypothetical protein
MSPPRPLRNEDHYQQDVLNRALVPHLRRALEAASGYKCTVQGGAAWPGKTCPRGSPDVTVTHQPHGPRTLSRDVRMVLPIEVKTSMSWRLEWRLATDANQNQCFHQVLSQVNFYMNQWDCRYCGLLTDEGLVVVERLNHPADDGLSSQGNVI